mmetsp:Transcript_56611/g.112434  ORF Transcript_56611/g.112434 Transcript_56611/m.112434 type:complete len:247 (+) Transcript_56611:1031-1771(+)
MKKWPIARLNGDQPCCSITSEPLIVCLLPKWPSSPNWITVAMPASILDRALLSEAASSALAKASTSVFDVAALSRLFFSSLPSTGSGTARTSDHSDGCSAAMFHVRTRTSALHTRHAICVMVEHPAGISCSTTQPLSCTLPSLANSRISTSWRSRAQPPQRLLGLKATASEELVRCTSTRSVGGPGGGYSCTVAAHGKMDCTLPFAAPLPPFLPEAKTLPRRRRDLRSSTETVISSSPCTSKDVLP